MQAGKVKSIDGVPIVYDVKGKGDIALVFVHCWCCDRGFWDAQVPYFSKKYKVVTLDLAGHGDSGLNRDKWTIEAYAGDVAVVVKELKLKKMILVGHSMGGPVIAATAKLMPDKVIGLIAVDTFLNIEQKMTDEQAKQFMAPLRQDFATGTRNFIMGYMFTPNSDPALKKKVADSLSEGPAKVGLGSMESMWKLDMAKLVKEADAHIRCINADRFPTNIEAGRRHARSFEVTIMKGVGHFLHMEKPAEFNRLMEESIKELLKLK
jgi:pimeloyl-ACP methyl ester carboxylesterase